MKTKKSECNGCNNFEYENSCRSQFKFATDGRSFSTLNTPDWCPGREEITKMKSMENKKCKGCGDYFSIKMGSKIEECLDCKSENDGDEVEKISTKKEVMERLQKACDEMNSCIGNIQRFTVEEVANLLYIKGKIDNGGFVTGINHNYRPEPKPPEKNALIIYVDKIKGNLELMYGFSSGFFSDGSEAPLCIIKKYNREPAFDKWDMTTNQWYCPSTGQKINWRDEWTPEEFRK